MYADAMPLETDLREKTRHGSADFPLQYYVDELYRFPTKKVPLHWHSELEFFVIRGGHVKIQVWNNVLKLNEGDGIFLNANVLHSFEQLIPEEKCECPNIVFSDELIAPTGSRINQCYIKPVILDKTMPFFILRSDNKWQNEILSHLDIIFSLQQKYGNTSVYGKVPILDFENAQITSPCFEIQVQNELNSIWQIIFSHLQELPRYPNTKQDSALQIRMQKMLAYIQNNYMFTISLANIASSADISKSEATRCFQKYMKISPVNYLLQYRIEKAKHLLQNPMKSVLEISQECGFQSSSYFCKMFRRETGTTAVRYREMR